MNLCRTQRMVWWKIKSVAFAPGVPSKKFAWKEIVVLLRQELSWVQSGVICRLPEMALKRLMVLDDCCVTQSFPSGPVVMPGRLSLKGGQEVLLLALGPVQSWYVPCVLIENARDP